MRSKLETTQLLFTYYPEFFIAPFDQNTEKFPHNSKRLFRKFIRGHEKSCEYFELNEKLIALLEDKKLLDAYHFAITGKPKFCIEAVRQQDALSEGADIYIHRLLEVQPSLVNFFFSNGRLIEKLAQDYENFLKNPPAPRTLTIDPPQILSITDNNDGYADSNNSYEDEYPRPLKRQRFSTALDNLWNNGDGDDGKNRSCFRP